VHAEGVGQLVGEHDALHPRPANRGGHVGGVRHARLESLAEPRVPILLDLAQRRRPVVTDVQDLIGERAPRGVNVCPADDVGQDGFGQGAVAGPELGDREPIARAQRPRAAHAVPHGKHLFGHHVPEERRQHDRVGPVVADEIHAAARVVPHRGVEHHGVVVVEETEQIRRQIRVRFRVDDELAMDFPSVAQVARLLRGGGECRDAREEQNEDRDTNEADTCERGH
jgi:hypothetical protein